MIKVSIYGGTGYTGMELFRRLVNRDDVEIVHLISSTRSGMKYRDVVGSVASSSKREYVLEDLDEETVVDDSDLIFTALPHGMSFSIGRLVKEKGKKLIDLGADYRLSDIDNYEKWYGVKHTEEEILKDAIYSIPELHRNKFKSDTYLVANPGCYTTASQLALAPLIKNDLIDLDRIVIDAKSGVSGAGRGARLGSLFSEVNENLSPYGTGVHRHKPEIEEHLGKLANESVKVMFSPHLVPMTRGILASIYVRLKEDKSEEEIREIYSNFYEGEEFVKILDRGVNPNTKWVYGSNYAHINFVLDSDTGYLVIFSAIDNLGKGASGQAIQNMNILFSLEEGKGIDDKPLFP